MRYDIERSEPSAYHCDCCGGLSVRLTGFVCRNGDAFAIYYVAYSNNHRDNELEMLVSLGEWGDDTDPSQRAAFYCRVRPTSDAYEVMLGDGAQSVWRDAELVGRRLSREEALRHPWKAIAFEVLDEAFVQDPSLRGFLHRVRCGNAAEPLEQSFGAPDDIFALGADEKTRAEAGRSFASLDGKRFFLRCLLPIPVEGYGSWSVGLWIEVEKSDFETARKVWDVPEQYSTLRFSGVIANDVQASLDLPIPLGSRVEVHVADPEGAPRVQSSTTGALADLLSQEWSKAAFEQYALARGFL